MRESRFRILPTKGIVAAAILSLGMGAAGAVSANAAPLLITVDCAAGDTIGAALLLARTTFDPVHITVNGMCKERILIDRDEITLRGADAASGIDGAGVPGTMPLIVVNDAHRILLDTLRLTPAGTGGLRLETGAAVRAWRLMIDGADFGVYLYPDTSLELTSSEVSRSTGTGISSRGGSLIVRTSAVYESGSAGISLSGGVLDMFDSKVVYNKYWGVSLIDNASGNVFSSSISNNFVGCFLRVGGRLMLGSGARVANNEGHGVRVWDSSALLLGANSTIEGNGAGGVHAMGASEVMPQLTTIKNNRGDGIAVRDTSLVTAMAGVNPTITANSGWGIRCEGFPGDARLASPGFGLAAVFANALGQINCPGYVIP
jgi:hypothetical protein